MKIRIRGNTIRLRLSRLEIEELANRGMVEDRICFGAAAVLTYRLEADTRVVAPTAIFEQSVITVRISTTDMQTWTGSELVGIYSEPENEKENTLRITLEKDFSCLEVRSSEEDLGSFPNPKNARQP